MATAAQSNKQVKYPVHYLVACRRNQNWISKMAGYPANQNRNRIDGAS